MRIIFIAEPSGGRPLSFMPDDQLKVAVADCAATSRYDSSARMPNSRAHSWHSDCAFFLCETGGVKTKKILKV